MDGAARVGSALYPTPLPAFLQPPRGHIPFLFWPLYSDLLNAGNPFHSFGNFTTLPYPLRIASLGIAWGCFNQTPTHLTSYFHIIGPGFEGFETFTPPFYEVLQHGIRHELPVYIIVPPSSYVEASVDYNAGTNYRVHLSLVGWYVTE